MSSKHSSGFIPTTLYRQILEHVPVTCVDAVIVHEGKFLLGKRLNKPARGKWWLIGGRVLKGERITAAIVRKVKEETGMKVTVLCLLGAEDTIFKNSAFPGVASHTINCAFLVKPVGKIKQTADSQHDRLQWFSHIEPSGAPYVKHMLSAAGFKEK